MLLSILNKQKLLFLSLGLLFLGLVFVTVLTQIDKAYAFTPNYNSSNLIDNPTFLNSGSMSAATIQTFLSNIGGGLANYSSVENCDSSDIAYFPHCNQTLSAAQLIYDTAQVYGINPEAILATMEKEQSLVTDPTPSSSQLNCAMGYNSCTNYAGFFTQIDYGTFTLRYNYEGAARDATWLKYSPASGYPCSTAKTNFYSNGLYPGNTVTFADSGGTAETVTLANAATASLYCYTPYVGPYSLTGYSGSYNFVYYFQLWFGSTQASIPYAWAYESQGIYSDATDTNRFTTTPSVAPGANIYLTLSARNVGYDTWQQSNLRVAVSNPTTRTSPFYSPTWINTDRPGGMTTTSVVPGGEATFTFTNRAPQQAGTYTEYYSLVADGVTYLNDPGLYYTINVVKPRMANSALPSTLSSGQTLSAGDHLLSQDAQSVLAVQTDGNTVLYSDQRATWFTNTYGQSAAFLAMQTDGNLVLYNTSNKPIWSSGTNGNAGAWLSLQTDGNLVVYSSSDTPLWSSNTLSAPNYLNTDDTTMNTGSMFPNQFIATDDGNYVLTLQTDGNLVLYYKGTALWQSGTSGLPVAFLAMQSDGNLVLYNNSDEPIWDSGTAGRGPSSLKVQPDGNVVIYTANNTPTWSTQTEATRS
jgi:hypothetical protein